MLFKLQLEDPTRHQRVTWPSSPRSCVSSVGAAGDRWPGRMSLYASTVTSKVVRLFRTRSGVLRSERGRCRTTHSLPALSAHHLCSFVFSCTIHQVVFRFFVALPFGSGILLVERWKNLDGSSPILGALKSTSLSRHTCHGSSSNSTETDGTVLCTISSPLLLTSTAGLFLCQSKMTASGHCADTHGPTG